MDYSDKRAIVTGGASGIGLAIARGLAQRGCKVAIVDVAAGIAKAAAASIGHGAVALVCDVSRHEAVEALCGDAEAALGGIVNLVFANAGVSHGGPILKARPEEMDWVLGVNVRGVWSTLAVFANRLIEAGVPGHLCITASEHSLGLQHAGGAFYTTSKHAVLGMAEVFRAELPATVGISVFCPGLTATNLHLTGALGPTAVDPAHQAFAGAVVGRGMDAAEVADACIAGVERGDFLIVSHPVSIIAARRRAEEVEAAFAQQAPWTDDAMRYDVNTVIAAVVAAHKKHAQGNKA